MMELLSKRMNFAPDAQELPAILVAEACDASRTITQPEEARAAFDRLLPALSKYRPHPEFAVACAMLIEKQRFTDGMVDFWADLRRVFPDEITTLRMMMRWYRRSRKIEQGIAHLHEMLPDEQHSATQADALIIGLAELKAYGEIDRLTSPLLQAHPDARALKMRLIRVLSDQSRYIEAQLLAEAVANRDRLGPASQDLLSMVQRRAEKLAALPTADAVDVLPTMLERLPLRLHPPARVLGQVTFFTGQLGTGGAERQMTRLATALQRRFVDGEYVGDVPITSPVSVCVRHATSSSGADYYLPDLQRACIETSVLADMARVAPDRLATVQPDIQTLMELLPADIFDHTTKLVPYFIARRTAVAYLWQDGGVLSAAVAALLAGVPRIVASFRGLPPNLRPNLFRPELRPLYLALVRMPQVSFSSNSQCTATAYEDWLALPAGTIKVIHNAITPLSETGDAKDESFWRDTTERSPQCTKTVLGVFRFDENKRPRDWIQTASRYAANHPDTRFVMVGGGYLHNECKTLIAATGMENRIFLTGVRKNVGFFMQKADLLMHLARMEGLPNVLIEAQLAGVPVLATPAGGTSEVVMHDVTGRILKSAETLRHADIDRNLHELLADIPRLRRMGHAARMFSTRRFSPDQILDRTVRLFLDPKGTP